MVPVLATGAAVAKNEPVGKGKESERVATGSAGAKDKLADKGKGKDRLGAKKGGRRRSRLPMSSRGASPRTGRKGAPLK
jgi:hypothetical protein